MAAVKVDKAPAVDGKADDDAWKAAKAYTIKVDKPKRILEPGKEVTLKVAHDGSSIYVLCEWADKKKNDQHESWAWDEGKAKYEKSGFMEDEFFVAFQLEGSFNANMTVGIDAKWDVWQWQAARTDPTGFARDKIHVYTHTKPDDPLLAARSRQDSDDKEWWMLLLDDAGKPPAKAVDAPKAKGKDTLPTFVTQTPEGSAADVRAKGTWKEGRWTVEFSRKLDTGAKDDRKFDLGDAVLFAVGVLNSAEGSQHDISLPHRLKFER